MGAVNFPYQINENYPQKVAYFSMEYAIDQALKIYSGGLGFLAGSHMRSVYDLQQPLVGVGILWSYGYYDQGRHEDGTLSVNYVRKLYSFIEDTGIKVTVKVFARDVVVKALMLKPGVFGTAPMYLLTTDTDENDYLSRTITYRLYDNTKLTRLAQSMVLGIGGAKVLKALGFQPDVYHMNEAHPLPLCFQLLSELNDLKKVQERVVFTTHTPEEAGNEKTDLEQVKSIGFFANASEALVNQVVDPKDNIFNHTLVALKMSRLANAVSKIHGDVSRAMWRGHHNICDIISITNAQNQKYWADKRLQESIEQKDIAAFKHRKKELKKELFEVVADQTGTLMDPEVLTIVWARRLAGYKRADLLLRRWERLKELLSRKDKPIQIIWAGKPYPLDQGAIGTFNHIHFATRQLKRCAILTGYELRLSRILKQGSDVWLNTPRITREASGTSGMSAAMNGSVNFSIRDGWMAEFSRPEENAFEIPTRIDFRNLQEQDDSDADHLFDILEQQIIPTYYDNPDKWFSIVHDAMVEVNGYFTSGRMADEYYRNMYQKREKVVESALLSDSLKES